MHNYIIKIISLCTVFLFAACNVDNNKLDEVYQIINDGNAELAEMKLSDKAVGAGAEHPVCRTCHISADIWLHHNIRGL